MSADGESTNAAEPAPEVCVRDGVACYLCDLSVVTGESAVVYRDARFWEQTFVYHARCWESADLPAKSGQGRLGPAPAIELPATQCLACRVPIETGDLIVREWVREGRGVRIYHAGCAPATRNHRT